MECPRFLYQGLRGYGTAAELSIVHQVEFHTATIMDYLFGQRLPNNSFDSVMCNGYFYHTHDHFQLLIEFCRIGRSLILDTEISPSHCDVLPPRAERQHRQRRQRVRPELRLRRPPHQGLLSEMLTVAGYTNHEYFNWTGYPFESTDWMKSDIEGKRITLRATR